MRVYVVGSLRKPEVEEVADSLRAAGHEVFDQWRAAGPQADDEWRDYFKRRNMSFKQALASPFVEHIVDFDRRWLDWCEAVVVLGPPGLSSGLELMYAGFYGKLPVLYYPEDPERWDAMLLLVPGLVVEYGLNGVLLALTEGE